MLFTEPLFLFLFLPLLLLVYCVSPARFRNPMLIAASSIFYFAGEKLFASILLASVLLNFVVAGVLGRMGNERGRRRALALGVVLNVLLLAVFKYADFVVVNLNRLLAGISVHPLPLPHIHLPIGISFFTFMGISYLIDLYRHQIKTPASLTSFALYITLFPHLIAGPIVRYNDIAAEIISRRVTRPMFAEGIRRFTLGFGKKMLLANTLAFPADKIFALSSHEISTGLAWLGVLCYTLQIYYDFSGYTDMAIGLARMLGFHFPENFNYPYIAGSITEFWRRWHMSLSTWFRDYLFFPLGVRKPARRIYLNLLLVFFLCGLWHGAKWNFVIWGLLHGLFLVLERMGLLRLLARAALLRHVYTLLVILIGWVFFRAETLQRALDYMGAMTGATSATRAFYQPSFFLTGEVILALAVGLVGCVPVLPALKRWRERLSERLSGAPELIFDASTRIIHAGLVTLVFVASATQSASGTYNPFIYFRF